MSVVVVAVAVLLLLWLLVVAAAAWWCVTDVDVSVVAVAAGIDIASADCIDVVIVVLSRAYPNDDRQHTNATGPGGRLFEGREPDRAVAPAPAVPHGACVYHG